MIHCEQITKRYRGRPAISHLSFRLEGGICGILGANGAGKSTLLRLITTLERADAGTIHLNGLDVMRDAVRVKQMIGVLPDQLGLFESLSVIENLLCLAPIYGLSKAETEARSGSLLHLLELQQGRNTVVNECSYGMRKKTALAMALLHNPRVLLLDEPFEGIDPSSSRRIEHVLTRAASRGVTVLFTSHILPLVQRLASRVVILGEGRIVWDSQRDVLGGTLEETYFSVSVEAEEAMLSWLG